MDKRLHSRLTNPQNLIMPSYRINKDWKQEEARIISEQAQKDALQKQATQEAAWAIANLERREAERNPWIAASKMTAIQGVPNMPYQPNEIADNDEPRMQVNDYNLYEANALPYKQGGVSLGVWRGGDPSQYVTFASDSLQPNSAGRTVAPMVGIDDVEGYALFARKFTEDNKEEIENLVNEIGRSTARVLGDAFKSKLISKLPIPIEMKLPVHILIFLYCAYQCAQSAYEKEVVPYMREHNCSVEEAAENTAVERAFFAEFGKLLLTTYVGMVASTFDISERTQLMIDALVGEVAERIFG